MSKTTEHCAGKAIRGAASAARRWLAWRPLALATALVMLLASILVTVESMGIGPDARDAVVASRTALARSLTMQVSVHASASDRESVERAVAEFVRGGTDVSSAVVVPGVGTPFAGYARSGPVGVVRAIDAAQALDPDVEGDTIDVPVLRGSRPWGRVRVVFAPSRPWAPLAAKLALVLLGAWVVFTAFLVKALVQLDPTRSVPGRVDDAFNLFGDGVLILDERGRVVLANDAAGRLAGSDAEALVGRRLGDWDWTRDERWQAPWDTVLSTGLAQEDAQLTLGRDGEEPALLRVACQAVGDDERRGVLVSLNDIGVHERHARELTQTLGELRAAQLASEEARVALERLANTDALTGVANRRVLMERLHAVFDASRADGTPMSVVMSDIDFFKKVNDTYGHGVGDDTIVAMARTLSAACREQDLVGRFGGEEFVLVLPGMTGAEAVAVSERVRIAVMAMGASDELPMPSLTSSFGVATLDPSAPGAGAADADALLEHADQALYVCKDNGRNQVVLFDADAGATSGEAEQAPAPADAPSAADAEALRRVELDRLAAERDHALARARETDPDTGAPLRARFEASVDEALARARAQNRFVAIVSIEVRELERLLSSFGHHLVDELVVRFIERLESAIADEGHASEIGASRYIARLRSNEFGALATDLHDPEQALGIVTRLRVALREPFCVDGEQIALGACIGVAVPESAGAQADEDDAAALIDRAALARSRAALVPGKVAHAFAAPELDRRSRQALRLENDLAGALERGEVEIHYQPKLDLRERRIVGVEALTRWTHPEHGPVDPERFVAVAEAGGLIGALTEHVLHRGLSDLRRWDEAGVQPLQLAVNVSGRQLQGSELSDATREALEATGVTPERLTLELTETAVIDDEQAAGRCLTGLRSRGIGIAMDDFGTGYTTLSLLASLPVDEIKIDRSFVSVLESSARHRSIVEAMVRMAGSLGLRTVAEGVETNGQLAMLAAAGTTQAQGYLIARPMSAAQLVTWMLVQQREPERRRAA